MKIVSVQEVDITMTGTSQTASITTVGDLSRSVVVGTWEVSPLTGNILADSLEVDMWLSDASTITIQRNGSDGTITATVFVIEFHSSVNVQKGTFTMADDVNSTNVTLSALTIANSFAMVFKRETETSSFTRDSSPAARHQGFRITTTTNLLIERVGNASATSTVNGHWWVVEDTDLDVTTEILSHSGASPNAHTLGASRSVVMADTFIVASMKTPEEQWNDEGNANIELVSTTAIETTDAYNTAEVETINAQVIEDSDLIVQHKKITTGTPITGTQSITSVDLTRAVIFPTFKSGNASNAASSQTTIHLRYMRLSFNSATEVAWSRNTGGGTGSGNDMSYQVVEFILVDPVTNEQEGYRFRNDDGSETTATWLASQDTNVSKGKEEAIRLRTLIDVTGNPSASQVTLQYKRTDEAATEWRNV